MKNLSKYLILFSLLGLVSCGKDSKTVRVAVPGYGEHTEESFKKIARDFEKENPDIKVKIEIASWNGWKQKIATDFFSGGNADVIYYTTAWMPGYIKEDMLEPLNDYVTPEIKSMFPTSLMNRVTIDGTIYALPSVTSARVLYVNKDLFEKAGVQYPKTWEELKKAAIAINKKTGAYGFGIHGKEVEMEKYFFYILWNFGGDVLDKDIGGKKSILNSPESIQAAQFYNDMIKEGATQPDVVAYNREDLQELFKQGKLAMVITHKLLADQIRDEKHNIEFDIIDVPGQSTNEKGKTLGVIDTVSIAKNSKVKEDAFKFLIYTLKPQYQADWIGKAGLLPVTIEAGEEEIFQDKAFKAMIKAVPNAKFAPLHDNYAKMIDILNRELQSMYSGTKSAEQAMKDASAEINKIL